MGRYGASSALFPRHFVDPVNDTLELQLGSPVGILPRKGSGGGLIAIIGGKPIEEPRQRIETVRMEPFTGFQSDHVAGDHLLFAR